MSTQNPRAALAWLMAGRSIRIAPFKEATAVIERFDYWRHIRALAELEARRAA